MEGASRRSLGTQAQHTFYGRPYMVYPIEHLQPHSITFNNKITNTPRNILQIVSPNNSQTLSNTQHTKQTDAFTGQYKTYKDTTLHSPLLRSKRQKQSKINNSQGPDKLNNRHLKHIGPLGLAFLMSMFKTALNKNIIPHTW